MSAMLDSIPTCRKCFFSAVPVYKPGFEVPIGIWCLYCDGYMPPNAWEIVEEQIEKAKEAAAKAKPAGGEFDPHVLLARAQAAESRVAQLEAEIQDLKAAKKPAPRKRTTKKS